MFKIVDSVDTDRWARFVQKNPKCNIFQTPEMAEVYERAKRMEPITLFAVKGNEIYASLMAYVSSEKGSILGRFSSRAIIQGGPIFTESRQGVQALSLLMDHYDNLIKKRALFTEIRMIHNIPEFSLLKKKGYEYEEHLNYLVDMDRPVEEMWKNVKKSRRYGIKSAEKANVIIEEVTDSRRIQQVYDLLLETYKNAELPIADISLFQSAFDLLAGKRMARFFLAKHNEGYIGTIVILSYKGVAYDWYAGASIDSLNLYPNDLLAWHAIENSSKKGCSVFDFGGAGKPNEKYGVREFKKQFGGDLVNFGRYKKVYSARKLKIAQGGFKIYRKLKW